ALLAFLLMLGAASGPFSLPLHDALPFLLAGSLKAPSAVAVLVTAPVIFPLAANVAAVPAFTVKAPPPTSPRTSSESLPLQSKRSQLLSTPLEYGPFPPSHTVACLGVLGT